MFTAGELLVPQLKATGSVDPQLTAPPTLAKAGLHAELLESPRAYRRPTGQRYARRAGDTACHRRPGAQHETLTAAACGTASPRPCRRCRSPPGVLRAAARTHCCLAGSRAAARRGVRVRRRARGPCVRRVVRARTPSLPQ